MKKCSFQDNLKSYKCQDRVKVKLSLHGLWRPSGLQEVEALTFSDIWLTGGGKVVSPMRRPLFTPRHILVLISVRG
jgi:hypothetical protein